MVTSIEPRDLDARRAWRWRCAGIGLAPLCALACDARSPTAAQAVPPAVGTEAVLAPTQAPFVARGERRLPAKPEGLCAADFDGDGFQDLVVSLRAPGDWIVWRGGALGLEREGRTQACGDYPLAPLALPAGRFGARDGRSHLLIASRATRMLEVVSPVDPSAAADTQPMELESAPRAVASALVDGRGLIAVACLDRRLVLLRDEPSVCEHWRMGGDSPRCALIDAEHGLVVVGFQDTTRLELYDSHGDAATVRLELGGIPRDLASLDVDGDGDLELVVAGGDRELWVFGAGAPGGSLAWTPDRPPRVWTTDAVPLALAVADFDADTRADLAVLHHYGLQVRMLTRLGAEGAGVSFSQSAGQTPAGLAALDANGDGRVDVAIANHDTLGLGFLPGDGAGRLIAGTSVGLGDFPNALDAVSARPGEGVLRCVALNAKAHTISVVVHAGGALRALPELACDAEPRAPRIAELDGVPGFDMAMLGDGPRGARISIFHGELDGRLAPAHALDVGGAPQDLLLLDLDGDGKLEAALCDPSAARVLLLDPLAASVKPGHTAALEVPSLPRALCAIELDGDPAPELACVLGAPGARVGVAWLDAKRQADGSLLLVELGFSAASGAPIAASAADLDGDGRQDLALLCTSAPESPEGSWTALLRSGQSACEFTSSAPLSTGQRPQRIVAVDVSRDGRAEVFVTAQNSHMIDAWTPAAGGAFGMRAFDDLGAGLGPIGLALADVDDDGWIDLCVANGFSNDLSVLHGRAAPKLNSNSIGR